MDGCLCPHSLTHPIHLTNTHKGNIIHVPLCKSPTIYHQCSLATQEFEVYNSTLQLVTFRLAPHASCQVAGYHPQVISSLCRPGAPPVLIDLSCDICFHIYCLWRDGNFYKYGISDGQQQLCRHEDSQGHTSILSFFFRTFGNSIHVTLKICFIHLQLSPYLSGILIGGQRLLKSKTANVVILYSLWYVYFRSVMTWHSSWLVLVLSPQSARASMINVLILFLVSRSVVFNCKKQSLH